MADPQRVSVDGLWQPLMTSANEPAKECCCTPPADCCLYPWPDPDGTPLYPDTDLPATIVLLTSEFNSFDPNALIILTRSGYEFIGTGPSTHEYTVTAHGAFGGWHEESEASLFSFPCLITGDFTPAFGSTEDEFPDTLTVSFDYIEMGFPVPYSGTINRVSNCCWEGVIGAYSVSVCYTAEVYVWGYTVNLSGEVKTAGQNQDTPTGNYDPTSEVSNFVVS